MILVPKGKIKQKYEITEIMPGPGGQNFPYLTMKIVGKLNEVEHDTGFDSRSSTYTVETV